VFKTDLRAISLSFTALSLGLGIASTADARPARAVAARPTVAAPVTLVRPDTDLFSATLAGRFAQGTDNPALAAQAWSRAFMRRSSDSDLFARAVAANVQVGDVAEAVRISKLVAPSLRNEDGALVLGVDAFAGGRYAEVTRALAGRSFQPSQRVFADHLAAYALLGQNKVDDAVNLTSRASGISALDKAALMSRAMILEQANRPEEAAILYQSAIDAGVRWPAGVRAYGAFLVRSDRKADAIALYQRLIQAGGADAGGFTVALAQTQAATALPTLPDLRKAASTGLVTIAQSLASEGRGGAPAGLFNLVAYVDPSSDSARVALANQLIADERSALAKPILNQIGATSPEYLSARTELVWSVFDDDQAGAVTLARDTVRAVPAVPAAKRLLADVLAANRQDREAEGLYSDLIDAGKASGQNNEMMWPLYFGRGGTRERQGNWTLALADLRIAKAAAPNQPNILNYLGYAMADRGENLDEALVMLRAAVRLRPRSGAILDSLGWALYKSGRYEEAVATLETASSMSAGLAEISDHLGDAYWRSGRQDEARIEWERTLRLETTQKQRDAIAIKLRDGLPPDTNNAARRAVAAQSGISTQR
jgi:tetratricopeptide (TPR) repeat protein